MNTWPLLSSLQVHFLCKNMNSLVKETIVGPLIRSAGFQMKCHSFLKKGKQTYMTTTLKARKLQKYINCFVLHTFQFRLEPESSVGLAPL